MSEFSMSAMTFKNKFGVAPCNLNITVRQILPQLSVSIISYISKFRL